MILSPLEGAKAYLLEAALPFFLYQPLFPKMLLPGLGPQFSALLWAPHTHMVV